MRRSVFHEPSPVDCECDVEILDDNIVNELVICTLQEGRVDSHDRLQSSARQAGRKCHSVLFGDGDVEKPVGKLFGKRGQAAAFAHCRGYGNAALISLCGRACPLSEQLGIVR